MMSWFYDLWEQNEDFFDQPALGAATPESQLEKLGHELEELKSDIGDDEEAADIMVCLIGFCIKRGMSVEDFLEALQRKTTKNLSRRWMLQPNGTYQHIKEES